MSSYYESIKSAEDILRAAESGAFDEQLGISPADRDLLTRAESGAIYLRELPALRALGRDDLVAAAHDTNRIINEEN